MIDIIASASVLWHLMDDVRFATLVEHFFETVDERHGRKIAWLAILGLPALLMVAIATGCWWIFS